MLMLKTLVTKPVLAPLLKSREFCLITVGILGAHLTLVALGLPGWPCPIRSTLGIPCPGCGLSRAANTLLRGNWREALTIHAFAPLFVLAVALVALVGLLPTPSRIKLVGWMEIAERRTGFFFWLLTALVVYWLARILLFPEILYNAIVR